MSRGSFLQGQQHSGEHKVEFAIFDLDGEKSSRDRCKDKSVAIYILFLSEREYLEEI